MSTNSSHRHGAAGLEPAGISSTRTVGVWLREFPLPADSFADLFPALARRRLPFILDSSLADGRLGRWSFAGFDPEILLTWHRGRSVYRFRGGREVRRERAFTALRRLLGLRRVERSREDGDDPFLGGAVGYLAYDLKNELERLPDTVLHDIRLPEMAMGLYGSVLAFEHGTGRCLLSTVDMEDRSLRGRKARAEEWFERWLNLAGEVRSGTPGAGTPRESAADFQPLGKAASNFTRSAYLAAVRRTIDYIAAGDIFQVNLSQRFSLPCRGSSFALYSRLRRSNPSPFGAYLSYPFGAVLSSSPERFLKVVGRHVETRPIKGTRPRTGDEVCDRLLRRQLLESEKDNAELTMIVDLERNDLGRVCSYGTVRVTEKRVLETYARVFHLVATVEGDLHEGKDVVDLLKAAFPGGSITGAPKIRAMQIIDELEPTARSVYTGAVGYFGLDGTCDLNIAIRTVLLAGGVAHVQVGGGIVADSDPEAEFQETLDKGRAVFSALGCEVEKR